MRRASFVTRASLLVGTAVAVPTLFACLDHPLKPVEYEGAQEKQKGIQLTVNKDVDILFVIDNSGSMGEEQANVAANFESFITVLEDPEVKANYRIGVTTTDNGNPWCGSTGPEAGKLQMTSCRQRQGEFVFNGVPPADVTQIACLDNCTLDAIDIQPTITEVDPDPKPRPWLESIEGRTNLPDSDGDGTSDYTTVEAFQCFGPQGIAGCGFESHLESMYKAFLRAEQDEEAQYGFLRSAAILAVVMITDEVDCSYNNDFQSIFLPEAMGGNPDAFWSDPTAAAPTSAVCWNAGVACTGSGSPYDECHSENKDVNGALGVPDDQAVLHPVTRYTGFLQELENKKQELTPDQQILVALIGGVPIGYEAGTADLVYQLALDPVEQGDFGIGAGCTNNMTTPVGTARPPVREKEFAEAFQVADQRNLFSVCSNDFSPALSAIADTIRDQIRPACMPSCVADINPIEPGLTPQCNLIQEAPVNGQIVETNIPQCNADGTLPADADVCFIPLTDKTMGTASTVDDMSPECITEGWNLEFRLVRAEDAPAPGGTSVKATCQLSVQKDVDCPDL